MTLRPIEYEYLEGNVLPPRSGDKSETGWTNRARLEAHVSRVWAPPVLKHGPRSATVGRVSSNEAKRRRETESFLIGLSQDGPRRVQKGHLMVLSSTGATR
jgi:hypothetical protein